MICAGCKRELGVGDRYIEGTAGDYLKRGVDPRISDLLADFLGGGETLGGGAGGKIVYCEDCTEPGGDFLFQTYWGDEAT